MSMFAAMILQAPGGLSAALGSPLIMMVIVMAIFYVILVLPQQRQRKKLQEMLGALKAGDKVVTNSGIYGTINGLDGDTVILKIAEQVKIRIARSAIAQVETTEDAK
jgi:preprotein translocase subunit YajC